MKICASCGEDLPRESFSKTQWKKDQRKCTSCVNYVKETEVHQHSDNADDEDGDDELLVCLGGDCNKTSWMTSWRQWLNKNNSTDKIEPLRRDCSCRGLAGYAHLSCLIEYARLNQDQWRGQQYHKLRTLWTECHVCKQPYQNELSMDMTSGFLYCCDKLPTKSSFDDRLDELASLAETLEGPRRESIDATMANMILRIRVNSCCKVEALSAKLAALVDNISSRTQANVCNRVGDGESGIEEEKELNIIKNIFNIDRILAWLTKRNIRWKLILEYTSLLCLALVFGQTAGRSSYLAFVVFVILCFGMLHWYGELKVLSRELCDMEDDALKIIAKKNLWLSDTQLRTARIEEGKEIGNRIFTLVDKMREDEPLNPKRIYVCEANAYNHLGDLAILEGKANAKEVSLEYYKKAQEHLKILEERTPEEFNMTATEPATESSIPLLAKTAETKRCEVSSSSSTNKKANNGKIACYRESYNLYVKELGQENLETIKTGQQLALALSDSNHKMEAEILLRELIAVSKRVHGAAHRSTEQSESLLRFIKEKKGSMKVGRKNKVRARAA